MNKQEFLPDGMSLDDLYEMESILEVIFEEDEDFRTDDDEVSAPWFIWPLNADEDECHELCRKYISDFDYNVYDVEDVWKWYLRELESNFKYLPQMLKHPHVYHVRYVKNNKLVEINEAKVNGDVIILTVENEQINVNISEVDKHIFVERRVVYWKRVKP